MTTPYLSVIVPVYNVEKYITQCLMSMVCDKAVISGMVEVIIIDDGSTDASGTMADDMAAGCSFVQVIHQENSGVAQARNAGISAARGKWLYFADSDDWMAENAVSALCKICREHENADIVLFDAYRNTSDKESGWEHFEKEMIWKGSDIHSLQCGVLYFPMLWQNIGRTNIPLAAPWDKAFQREFILKNNLSFHRELKVLDDMVFNMEAFGCATWVHYVKEKIYHYRYVADSITNTYKPNRVEQDKEVWGYIQKYMERMQKSDEDFMQAFYARVIKSFSICCRLQFFNPKNEKSIQEKIKDVKRVLEEIPYREAFLQMKPQSLEWKLKFVVLLGRHGLAGGVYLLYLAESMLFKLRH